MVHFPNARIDIAVLSVTSNEEGTPIKTFDFTTPIDSFEADVQPNVLTKEQIELYGINDKTAKTKKVFYTKSNFMLTGNRAKVTYNDGTVEYYNICPQNEWRVHSEALLIPVENEEEETPEPTPPEPTDEEDEESND